MKKIRKKIGRIIYFMLRQLPVKENYIYFESFAGKAYSDSVKYIYEELEREKKGKYRYVWGLKDLSTEVPGEAIKVRRPSFKYLYYIARSKYWVCNARMPAFLKKRKEGVYLQTWHGTPLKKLGFDIDEVHMPGTDTEKYRENFKKAVGKWDYLISPNNFSTRVLTKAFRFEGKLLETGYPRNDLFYQKDLEERSEVIKEKLGIPRDKKVILYAPTWRDDENEGRGKYNFTLPFTAGKMSDLLGEDYIILFRMHYLISDNLELEEFGSMAKDVSKYPDISELYLISDLLITDYSSVMFDYANLKRPMIFYTYDLERYRDKLRGFYFDFEKEAPGPLVSTEESVYESIKNVDVLQKKYNVKIEKFRNNFCHLEDGNASKRVVEKVFN